MIPALCGLAAVMLAALVLLLTRLQFLVVVVDGPSMSPGFVSGDRVLARRMPAGVLRAGQVVVLRHPAAPPGDRRGPWLVKRIAALPGNPVPEPVRSSQGWPAGTVVPPGHLVALGDNSGHSYDSRQWGLSTLDDIAGVIVRRLGGPPEESGSTRRSPR
ncbi:MAG TPA: S26 family signal peptidase [Actinophytocola sp.]|uniref:S26 family signal peptidase n=1 Tax=Actinophytocola sp. TaxID=1872138 RepID=UPI002DB9CB35|nr:S26 family signal peptidase [Actinophytocola sp.]HEU5471041.1 S26 family signal peptidase [Actinophytocola sp.]